MNFSQLSRMSSDLMCRVMMVLLTYPVAVVLSSWIGERGCGHPISFKALRRGTISWANLKRAASSASPAEA